jgi:hypothetical protein
MQPRSKGSHNQLPLPQAQGGMAWCSREFGVYRASLNLPPPAMLFSNGDEQPSTASSPQSAPETPDSNSSDIAEPGGLPSQLHHNWNSWAPLSAANNQITLEDIIHESAMIECVLAGISPSSHAERAQRECVSSASKSRPCLAKYVTRSSRVCTPTACFPSPGPNRGREDAGARPTPTPVAPTGRFL